MSEQSSVTPVMQTEVHGHLHHHRKHSKIKPVLYAFLAFMLALVLFLLSVCAVLYCTVFSKSFMIRTMRSIDYYSMVREELESQMVSLVDAGGFDKDFAKEFVESYDIKRAVNDYIAAFYSGGNTLVDTSTFKRQLNDAINSYMNQHRLTANKHTKEHIAYFVDEATEIYVEQMSIPFFSAFANYITHTKTILNMLTVFLAASAVVLSAIIFFTNPFKHRRCRYLFIGVSGAFWAVLVIPVIALLSGKIGLVNIATHSLYQLFVSYFNGLFCYFFLCAGVLFVLSVILLLLYIKYYRRALGR